MSMFDVPEEIYNNRINKIYGHEEAQSRVYDCEGTQLKIGDTIRKISGRSFLSRVVSLVDFRGIPSVEIENIEHVGYYDRFIVPGLEVKWEETE